MQKLVNERLSTIVLSHVQTVLQESNLVDNLYNTQERREDVVLAQTVFFWPNEHRILCMQLISNLLSSQLGLPR